MSKAYFKPVKKLLMLPALPVQPKSLTRRHKNTGITSVFMMYLPVSLYFTIPPTGLPVSLKMVYLTNPCWQPT